MYTILRFELRGSRGGDRLVFFCKFVSPGTKKFFFNLFVLDRGCRLPSPGRGYTFLHLFNLETGLSIEDLRLLVCFFTSVKYISLSGFLSTLCTSECVWV